MATHIYLTGGVTDAEPRVQLNKVAAQQGQPLVHMEFGPIEFGLHSSAEARLLKEAFASAEQMLADVEVASEGEAE